MAKKMKLDPSGKTSFILRLDDKLIRNFLQPQADENLTTVQDIIRRMITKAYNEKEAENE